MLSRPLPSDKENTASPLLCVPTTKHFCPRLSRHTFVQGPVPMCLAFFALFFKNVIPLDSQPQTMPFVPPCFVPCFSTVPPRPKRAALVYRARAFVPLLYNLPSKNVCDPP